MAQDKGTQPRFFYFHPQRRYGDDWINVWDFIQGVELLSRHGFHDFVRYESGDWGVGIQGGTELALHLATTQVFGPPTFTDENRGFRVVIEGEAKR